MTTVGYGDVYPVTNGGRFVGAFLMIVGVALFGVIAAFVANLFLSPRAHADGTSRSPRSTAMPRAARAQQRGASATEIRARLDRLEASDAADRAATAAEAAMRATRRGARPSRPASARDRSGTGA